MMLLNEREKTHGAFLEVSHTAQALKECLRSVDGSLDEDAYKLPCVHSEAMEMICTKLARIVCGDHNEPDHWTDIKGYAELVLKHIKAVPPGSSTNGTPDEPKDPSIGDDWDYNPRSGLSR